MDLVDLLRNEGHGDLADEVLRRREFPMQEKPAPPQHDHGSMDIDTLDTLDIAAPDRIAHRIQETANVVSVAHGLFAQTRWDTSESEFRKSSVSVLVVATADGAVKFYDSDSYALVHVVTGQGAVLSLHQNPVHHELWLLGRMNGTVTLLNTQLWTESAIAHHRKYVNQVCWSDDGVFAATASSDASINIFKYEGPVGMTESRDTTEPCNLVKIATLFADIEGAAIETALFLPNPTRLVYSVRGDYRLWYYNLETRRKTPFNLNPNGDRWTSFNIMCIQRHPSEPLLSLQTDTTIPRVLIYPFESSSRVRTLYLGSDQSDFSRPRHVWAGPSSLAVSSDDGVVRVVDIHGRTRSAVPAHGPRSLEVPGEDPAQRRARLSVHTSSVVRTLAVFPRGLVTGGFDRTVKVLTSTGI